VRIEYVNLFYRIFFSFLLLSSIRVELYAQLNATVYEDFTQTQFNSYLINPSVSDSSYSLAIRLNNINGIGITKNVRRFYLDLDKRIETKSENGFHYVGLQATNLKLGDYISKSRLQLRYSWYAKLSRRSAISSGISLGFINYAFLTTQGGTGGSDFSPDGSVGIHYLRQKFSFGFAIQQVLGTVLIPVNQSYSLQRLYNFDITRKFQIAHNAEFNTQFIVQIPEGGKIYSYGVNLHAEFLNFVYIGLSNFTLNKTSVALGAKRIVFLDSTFFLAVSYSMYHSQIPLPDNAIEIFISFQK
jgi:hypothetical protein